jgi:hypothetical protein
MLAPQRWRRDRTRLPFEAGAQAFVFGNVFGYLAATVRSSRV